VGFFEDSAYSSVSGTLGQEVLMLNIFLGAMVRRSRGIPCADPELGDAALVLPSIVLLCASVSLAHIVNICDKVWKSDKGSRPGSLLRLCR
jgi:hypothetical protein